MILALAQTKPKRGDIKSNLVDHYNMINLASKNHVDLIVFPEMSITGYERENARSLAFTEYDPRLYKLRQLSVDTKMILIVGAPIMINEKLFIGAFILKPDYSVSIYTKQYLHSGEERFFDSSFDYNPLIKYNMEEFSIAICADICNPKHPNKASQKGTTVYVSSIFYTPSGIAHAHKTLRDYSKQYRMNVLMSNYCGQSWGVEAAGQSAFWNNNGDLIASLNESDCGLLIVENTNNSWISKILKYE